MSTWWESCRPGDPADVVLIQFDLMGHSPWAASQPVEREPAKDRTEFALVLRLRLGYEGFDSLYWLGDGGVFARPYKRQEDADAAVNAADVAFDYFSRFKGFAIGADKLSFRATATLVKVLLYPEASHWFSAELNEFLKYERELALPDAFVITHRLYKELNASRHRFPKPRKVKLPSGGEISAYTDQKHPFHLVESPKRFLAWLKENANQLPDPDYPTKGKLEMDVAIGNSVIVDTAPSEAGYTQVRLIQTDFPLSEFEDLMKPFAEEWEKRKGDTKHLTGSKGPALRVTPPVSDDPALYIEYATVDYNLIYPFHQLVQENPSVQEKLVEQAFRFRNPDGRRMPSALAIDAAIIIADKQDGDTFSKDRYLLLAHRVQRQGGYYPNCWSASFEEQFAVVKSEWGGKIHPADNNLNDTVIRGLREEFLSDNFTGTISVTLQAVFIDLVNLNLQLMAVVKLADTSFSKVKELWSSGEAIDSKEHDVLAAIKLERDILRRALSAKGPDGLIEIYSNPELEDNVKHPWHPRSQARIACCLWMLEEGLL